MFSSKPHTYKVKDSYVHEINIKPALSGYVNNFKNLILYNYYHTLFNLMTDTSTSLINIFGSTITASTNSDANYSTIGIVYGTGASPPAFGNYSLTSMTSRALSTSSISCTQQECILNFVHTPSSSYSEIGLIQRFGTSSTSSSDILLTRTVMNIQANKQVIYRLRYGYPFTESFARIMYGFHMDQGINTIRVDGNTFTARTSGDLNNGSVYIVASQDAVEYSTSLYYIPNAFTIPTSNTLSSSTGVFTSIISTGSISPQDDITVRTIGLYQNIFDTGGGTHTVCVAVIPLATPITFRKGVNNCILLRLLAL